MALHVMGHHCAFRRSGKTCILYAFPITFPISAANGILGSLVMRKTNNHLVNVMVMELKNNVNAYSYIYLLFPYLPTVCGFPQIMMKLRM